MQYHAADVRNGTLAKLQKEKAGSKRPAERSDHRSGKKGRRPDKYSSGRGRRGDRRDRDGYDRGYDRNDRDRYIVTIVIVTAPTTAVDAEATIVPPSPAS